MHFIFAFRCLTAAQMSLRPIPIQKNLDLRIQPGIDTRQFFREILMYRGLADSVFPRRASDGGAVTDHIIRQYFTAFTVFGIPCLQKSSSAFRIADCAPREMCPAVRAGTVYGRDPISITPYFWAIDMSRGL